LDVGCGNGKSSAHLREHGCVVTGIDISETAVNICRERLPDALFLPADAACLPFPDQAFDLVLLVHVLEHLGAPDRTKAIEEAWRVLVEGGTLYIQSFSVRDLRNGKGERIGDNSYRRGNGINYHYFDETEILSLVPSGCQFDLEEVSDPVRFGLEGDARVRWRCRMLRPPRP
jgi:SAM-dependent methyltransferase